MLAEFLYRGVTAGFYGAITQTFGAVQPAWCAGLFVAVLLPVLSHSLEISVHMLRGTPKIITSLVSSVCFTIFSTLFNLYAMRRGALVVGEGAQPIREDLRRIPGLIAGFIGSGAMSTCRWVRRQYRLLRSVGARVNHVHDGARQNRVGGIQHDPVVLMNPGDHFHFGPEILSKNHRNQFDFVAVPDHSDAQPLTPEQNRADRNDNGSHAYRKR